MIAARRMVLLCLMFLIAGWTSCGSNTVPPANPDPPAPPPPAIPDFDADAAFSLLEAQVNLGVRAPGTDGHDQCEEFIHAELSKYADKVIKQDFQAATTYGGPYDFTNIIGFFGPETGTKLMLCAHWDTRPVADEDPDQDNQVKPVPGANDGASGVAVLLELARAFAESAPPIPIIMAFWDAEDSGDSSNTDQYNGFLIGSDYYVKHWPEGGRPDEVILLDIVGGDSERNERVGTRFGGNSTFDLPIERYSLEAAPNLVNEIYTAAESLGHDAFKRRLGYRVIDDHKPFIDAGIPAVDIIEFDYPEWHTVDDTPEHCDPDSLKQVGETLLEVIYSRTG